MLSNELYNLMQQCVQENQSLWRIQHMYNEDAGDCESCNGWWEKMKQDKEQHIEDLKTMIKEHLDAGK